MVTEKTNIDILLIEDSSFDEKVIRQFLKRSKQHHFFTHCVKSVSRAIKLLDQIDFDLVLLDLMLPDSSGLETLESFIEKHPDLPVVVLTNLDDEKLSVQSLKAGAQDYLMKGDMDAKLLARIVLYALERKRVENKLLAKDEELRQSQKMETVGRLAGGVAHDFNNLLTVISGYSDLFATNFCLEGEQKSYIQEIRTASQKAMNLTSQLLAFSRRQVIQPQKIDLNEIILNADKMIRRLIGEDVELTILPYEKVCPIKIDPNQLEQVLINFVVNARDAMPQGGALIVEVYCDSRAKVRGEDSKEYAVLAVSDNGEGISKEVKDKIFEPFFTTKDVNKGTGLGLATSQSIIELSGGFIEVESEENVGTTFKVCLPKLEEVISNKKESLRERSIPTGNETILVVEDDDSVRKFTTEILNQQGYRVFSAANGEEALRFSERNKNLSIDLVVSDLIMPLMNGREMFTKMRAVRKDLKILYMSGYTDKILESDNGLIQPGINFIQKPFKQEEISFRIRDILDGASHDQLWDQAQTA